MDESAAVEARAKVAMVEVDVPKDEDTPELRAAAFEAVFREFSLAPKMLRFAQHVGSMVEDREEEERRAMMVGWKEGTDVGSIDATIAETTAGQKAAAEGSGTCNRVRAAFPSCLAFFGSLRGAFGVSAAARPLPTQTARFSPFFRRACLFSQVWLLLVEKLQFACMIPTHVVPASDDGDRRA